VATQLFDAEVLMKQHFVLILMLLLGHTWSLAQDALAEEEGRVATLPIIVAKDKTFDDHLFGFRQPVLVEGVVEGDVGAIDGFVTIKGTVKGNVSLLGGSVQLYEGAVVEGNIVAIRGEVKRHKEAEVGGDILSLFEVTADSDRASPTTVPLFLGFWLGGTLFVFLLLVITFYLFPNQVQDAAFELTQDVVRPIIIGTLFNAGLILALFFSFLLMVVLVGFPLFLLLFSGAFVIITFGTVVVVFQLAQTLQNTISKQLNLAVAILLASLLVSLMLMLPYLRIIAILALLFMGSGIVIETRFGTNKNWFTRKKRYWAA
jgi:hypothetical protein